MNNETKEILDLLDTYSNEVKALIDSIKEEKKEIEALLLSFKETTAEEIKKSYNKGYNDALSKQNTVNGSNEGGPRLTLTTNN